MPNIIDYLRWRGDLDFKQYGINEIDTIILSRFSYLPFKKINLNKNETIENISIKMKNIKEEEFIWGEDKNFIDILGKSSRYKDLNVSNYQEIVDLQAEKQFSAITISLPGRYKYISFRGTDTSLVGWKEDFNMSFMRNVPSQKEAVKYLNEVGKRFKMDKLIVGGHSKGGNLAVYSSTFCEDKIKKRIIKIINADGPGFDKSIILSEEYKKIVNKIETYIPQSSIVGRLLEHEEEYQVIYSTQKGIMQHDIYSWQVEKTNLIHMPTLSNNSQVLDRVLKNWLENTTIEQRKNFINIIYEVIIKTEAETINDFGIDTVKKITRMLKSYKDVKKEDRKEIEAMIKLFFESTINSIRGNKERLG